MIHAYLIEDVRALADLFKVNQAPKRSANGMFTAYRIRHPEFSARRALVLIGVQSSALVDDLPKTIGREIHAAVEVALTPHTEKVVIDVVTTVAEGA